MNTWEAFKDELRSTGLDKRLDAVLRDFYLQHGMGQYSHSRFAHWLVEDSPYLTADILAPVLERLFAKENTTPVEEVV